MNVLQLLGKLKSSGYIIGNVSELGILRHDMDDTRTIVKKTCGKLGYGEQFHRSRKKAQMELDTRSLHFDSELNTPISRKIPRIFQMLGFPSEKIWYRISQYKPYNSHISDGYNSTSVHRDVWDDNKVDLLMVLVLEQKNVKSNMKILRTDKERYHRNNSFKQSVRSNIDGCETLENVEGQVGTYYIINQRDFPDLYHYVYVSSDEQPDTERIVLTYGITYNPEKIVHVEKPVYVEKPMWSVDIRYKYGMGYALFGGALLGLCMGYGMFKKKE